MNSCYDVYKGKKVFITGHTGFKGSWLSLWLKLLGADVCGYSLEPDTNPSLFEILNLKKKIKNVIGDILDNEKLKQNLLDFKPDIIFHLAAQSLVRLSYREPQKTYQTNVIGALNVLEAARNCPSTIAFVNITSDKCYENIEQRYHYREDDKLGGYDMYSSSKACSEILSSSYRNSFLKNNGFLLATARAGNVIGGGDWASDRLVPGCIRSIMANEAIILRNPSSIRPWQYVLEPLSGYLSLGANLLKEKSVFAQSYNFGPDDESILSVENVANLVVRHFGVGKIIVQASENLHEAELLMLDIGKAKKELNWKPTYSIEIAIQKTVEWYKKYYDGREMRKYSISAIDDYMRSAEN
ncbi:MAG: CDP-glucose 4,6-dehydratase [Tannerella sp.]|jgi:CDP-glucose 4,6-dehydratase|nr:CDP-glucose 4,6-dehydratase [Tannerella sp.]